MIRWEDDPDFALQEPPESKEKNMATNKIIKSGRKRYGVYIFGAIIAVAIALATLVTVGVISKDDIEAWMLLVVGLVGAIVQFVTNVLAALNTDRDEQPARHVD